MNFWVYPGVYVSVDVPMKITMTPVMPGEVPPAGTTIIPPQTSSPTTTTASTTPMAQTIQAAVAANLEVARQGAESAQAITNQQTAEAQAAFDAALAKSNEEAGRLAAAQQALAGQPIPWSVTFTQKQ